MSFSFNFIVRRYIQNNQRRKLVFIRKRLRDSQNPFEVSTEEQFIDLYRLPKHLCLEFLDKIKSYFFINERRSAIPIHLRFLAALRFFASGSFQRGVGQDFMSCLSQTSIHRSIHEVTDILNEIWSDYVFFPDEHEQATVKEGFYEIASFPGVIGLIDGSHIKIIAPNRDIEHAYYCRKGGHSINLLIVCDSKYMIRYANAKFPGTSHDAYVWRRSALYDFLKRKYEEGKRNFWLLGDSGFPLQPWLMTPFNSPTTTAEENYNVAHKKTRCMVERCIGILKSRFRCISSGRQLGYNPTKAGKIINACIILHNILQRANISPPNDTEEEVEFDLDNTSYIDSSLNILREGQAVRQSISQTYFS